MYINLHQLSIFRAVAVERNYSRAAETLFLTQPAVSLQVRALERTLGLPLFERSGRHLRMTDAGQQLYAYSERIFALLDETQLVMEELSGARRGKITLAASTTAGIYVVPAALGAFHRQHPSVQLALDVVNRFTVQERLLGDEVDLAVMGLIENAHDLEVATFVPNELVVIAPPNHSLGGRERIALDELRDEMLLLREKGSGTRTDVVRLLGGPGGIENLPMRMGMELRSSGAIKQAVSAGLGIAVMPQAAIELEMQTQRLITLNVDGFPVHRHWYLARRSGRHLSAAADALWEFLLSYRDEIERMATLGRDPRDSG